MGQVIRMDQDRILSQINNNMGPGRGDTEEGDLGKTGWTLFERIFDVWR
jgi:hypothetical protein